MIEQAKKEDIQRIYRINQAFIPKVSQVDELWFHHMLELSPYFYVYRYESEVAGFVLCLPPDQDYDSLNYQWFEQNHKEKFLYVDRIAIDEAFQRRGIGRKLYTYLADTYSNLFDSITCEVNIRPRNDFSLDFHHKLGFKEVGQQDTEGGSKRVSLLAKQLNI